MIEIIKPSGGGGGSGLTSVGLTMPTAFTVTNSPLIANGTIAVAGSGNTSQYVRGDGTLATLPTGGGGGASVNYYLNGSVASSVVGYQQMSSNAVVGTGTDYTLSGNGLIAQFLSDIGNPNRIQIPAGAWNFEMYFQSSSSGGNVKFYVELLKYNGTTFTSIASSSSVPEQITGGTSIDLYLTSIAVPTTVLLATDRLAIRVYIVDNSGGRTITLHTEDNTLCEIITTFTTGISSLNGLTESTQLLAVGTTGSDFAISSSVDTHTFNLPTASAVNRGALSSADWTTFNSKGNGTVTSVQALTLGTTGTDLSSTVANGSTVPVITLNVPTASAANRGALSSADWSTFNDKADKLITTNRQTASYTLVIGDANKLVEMNVATANNLTIPLDSTVAYSIGTQILISQYGAGQTSVVATVGVTVRSSGGKLKLNAQYSGATLIKIATNEWYLFGDIAA